MAADTVVDSHQQASKSKRNNKKKKSKAAKAKLNDDAVNGSTDSPEQEVEDVEVEVEDLGETPERRPSTAEPGAPVIIDQPEEPITVQPQENGTQAAELEKPEEPEIASLPDIVKTSSAVQNDAVPEPALRDEAPKAQVGELDNERDGSALLEDHKENSAQLQQESDTEERLAAAANERDQLKAEVTELRKSLEEIQQRHEEESSQKQTRMEEAQAGKEHAETRYQKLLSQVNMIKAQLGERLKADAAELAQARTHIEDLDEQKRAAEEQKLGVTKDMEDVQNQNRDLREQVASLEGQYRLVKEDHDALQSRLSQFSADNERQEQEISNLRSRSNVSQQNWARQRDDFLQREASAREEFEAARQAMQDWEVLAMEERSVREGLGDRVAELEEQLSTQQEAYDRAASERDSQSATVDGLQRALQDIQEARKVELRELVEGSQAQLEELQKQVKLAEESLKASQLELATAKQDLERVLPFEKEVKEKNLLIGKLRHEAVILNDHLTKALRFLKKGKPENNVDRQLVTNHFLQFLTLDRSDPKKFQILLLIAALLGWTDEQKESAGLARPGGGSISVPNSAPTLRPAASTTSLRFPLSPFRRAASPNPASMPSPTLANAASVPDLPSPSAMSSRSESLAELWSDFLEREAQDGVRRESVFPAGAGVRRESGMTSPTTVRSPGPGSREVSGYGRFNNGG